MTAASAENEKMWEGLSPRDRAKTIVKGYRGSTLDHKAKIDALVSDIAEAIERAVRAETNRCAVLVGAWPTMAYGAFQERLMVQRATVEMAAAIRDGNARMVQSVSDQA